MPFRLFLRAVWWIVWGLRGRNRENVPADGPFILVSNHQSYMDPILIDLAQDRGVAFMAMAPLFKSPFWGPFLRWWGAFPVELERLDTGALRTAIASLKDGQGLVVFPEGGRSRDNKLMPLRDGVAQLALRTGAPVVPARIDGIFDIWPPQRAYPRLGRPIVVTYGPPIEAPQSRLNTTERREAAAEMMRRIESYIGTPQWPRAKARGADEADSR